LLLVFPVVAFLLTFAFSGGGTSGLSGVVKDAYTGKPVAGASVSTANATVTTNDSGAFSMDDSTATMLTVSRDNYASTQVAVTPASSKIEVALRPTTISGIIKDKKSGDPMPGLTVVVTASGGQSVSAVTDQDGKYVLENVPDGGTLTVQLDGATVATSTIGNDAKLDFEIRPAMLTGTITDESGKPIPGVTVAVGEASAQTGADGTYRIPGVPENGEITVKKPGYVEQTAKLPDSLKFDAALKEFRIKAIYATANTVGIDNAWNNMLAIADQTQVNAIVVDLKDSSGNVFYDTQVAMAEQIGAKSVTFDVKKRLQEMKDHDIYSIARIVCFEDPILAASRPDLAIHDSTTGGLWTTWNGLAWVNAHQREVWQYNIDLAKEAAQLGFDEVQLDYIRFPSDGLLENADYGPDFANETRLQAITGFLGQMQAAIKPTGTLVAVDLFGITMWYDDDGGIGQNLKAIAPLVDIICPMIYPSHFAPGEMGFDIPNNHPYEVIKQSLAHGASMDPDAAHKLRPWLQDFSYGEGIDYGDAEVAAQIQAADEYDGNGWLLWSPSNEYHTGALSPE
jgi:hypothetical protein